MNSDEDFEKVLEEGRSIRRQITAPLLKKIAELEKRLRTVRNEVLEEAAKEAESRLHAGDAGPAIIVKAIRALKDTK